MKKLKNILNKYSKDVHLGEAPRQEMKQEELKKELGQSKKVDNYIFLVCVIMLAVLFVFSLVIIILFLNDPAKITAVFGVTGVSLAWIIRTMIKIGKQKSYVDIILTLAAAMKPKTFESVISAIMKKL